MQEDSLLLVNAASSNRKLSPSDIRRVLSSSDKRSSNNNTSREANVSIVYTVSNHSITSNKSSFNDQMIKSTPMIVYLHNVCYIEIHHCI